MDSLCRKTTWRILDTEIPVYLLKPHTRIVLTEDHADIVGPDRSIHFAVFPVGSCWLYCYLCAGTAVYVDKHQDYVQLLILTQNYTIYMKVDSAAFEKASKLHTSESKPQWRKEGF